MSTAREFLNNPAESKEFHQACNRALIPPTRRQVRKWRRQEGKAYKEGRQAISEKEVQ